MGQDGVYTGGKDSNTQWGHAEYIVITVFKESQYIHQLKFGRILNILNYVTSMYLLGKF